MFFSTNIHRQHFFFSSSTCRDDDSNSNKPLSLVKGVFLTSNNGYRNTSKNLSLNYEQKYFSMQKETITTFRATKVVIISKNKPGTTTFFTSLLRHLKFWIPIMLRKHKQNKANQSLEKAPKTHNSLAELDSGHHKRSHSSYNQHQTPKSQSTDQISIIKKSKETTQIIENHSHYQSLRRKFAKWFRPERGRLQAKHRQWRQRWLFVSDFGSKLRAVWGEKYWNDEESGWEWELMERER